MSVVSCRACLSDPDGQCVPCWETQNESIASVVRDAFDDEDPHDDAGVGLPVTVDGVRRFS